MEQNAVVELKNITKIFPGVVALDDMSLTLRAGQIHGLIGENGAGKSTLIKVLTGVHIPEKGEILIDGKPVCFREPIDAKRLGISCVYQELNIVDQMSIVDNIFMGISLKKKNGMLDKASMRREAEEALSTLRQKIDIRKPCGELGVGLKQMVEISRAIVSHAKVLILDEPTASLSGNETKLLFGVLEKLKKTGIAILFISHKIDEIFAICDEVTVMRDSKHVITCPATEVTSDELITHMVGRKLSNLYPKEETTPGEVALEVKNLNRLGEFHNVSFTARKGEITSFSGLVGAGRTELFNAIFGVTHPDSGEILIDGKPAIISDPHSAIEKKIALLSEDRKKQGLVLDFTIAWNLTMVVLSKLTRGIFLDKVKLNECAQDAIKRLQIKVSGKEQTAGQLSGGNQQKVVIGKWINSDSDIFIFDEPTRGIDVGAKIEVYEIMNELAKQNKCVIVVSSELYEVLGMSDKVIVMHEGEIVTEIRRGDSRFNDEEIMKAAWRTAEYE